MAEIRFEQTRPDGLRTEDVTDRLVLVGRRFYNFSEQCVPEGAEPAEEMVQVGDCAGSAEPLREVYVNDTTGDVYVPADNGFQVYGLQTENGFRDRLSLWWGAGDGKLTSWGDYVCSGGEANPDSVREINNDVLSGDLSPAREQTYFLEVAEGILRNPEADSGLRLWAAGRLRALGGVDKTAAVYESIAEDSAADSGLRLAAANWLRNLEEVDRAVAVYESIAGNSAANSAHRLLAADRLRELGGVAKAVAGYEAIAGDSGASSGDRLAAAAGLRALEEVAKAVAVYESIAGDSGADPRYRLSATDQLRNLGEIDMTVAVYESIAGDSKASSGDRLWVANQLMELGEIAKAVAGYVAIMDADAEVLEVRHLMYVIIHGDETQQGLALDAIKELEWTKERCYTAILNNLDVANIEPGKKLDILKKMRSWTNAFFDSELSQALDVLIKELSVATPSEEIAGIRVVTITE